MKLNKTSQGYYTFLRVTEEELNVIKDALQQIDLCMEYDRGMQRYIDGGRFIMNLQPSEMVTLKDLREALK